MQRNIAAAIVIAALIGGCSTKSLINSNQLNALMIEATFLEEEGYYENAAQLFKKLYETTGVLEFLKKSVSNYYRAQKYDEALALLQKALKKESRNSELWRLEASLYMAKGEYEKAKRSIKKALALKKSAKNYEYLASILLAQKRYELALKYYKSAYALNPSIHNVNTIAYIMFFYLDKKKEALAYLETHTRIYGCQKEVCKTLISLYGLENNVDGLISVYKRLYQTYKDERYLRKLIDLYVYEKEYKKAIEWAKKLNDKEFLLGLYKAARDFHNAYKLALELYKTNGDPKYLAEAAIFEYEGAKKKDAKLLKSVAQKLEKAIRSLDDPLYLNYLGYLYIDHDIDIQRGIELVQRALRYDPDSPYYLDSLAWGYYKVHRCKEALKLIQRVYYELGLKDSEIEYHLHKIRQCAKDKK